MRAWRRPARTAGGAHPTAARPRPDRAPMHATCERHRIRARQTETVPARDGRTRTARSLDRHPGPPPPESSVAESDRRHRSRPVRPPRRPGMRSSTAWKPSPSPWALPARAHVVGPVRDGGRPAADAGLVPHRPVPRPRLLARPAGDPRRPAGPIVRHAPRALRAGRDGRPPRHLAVTLIVGYGLILFALRDELRPCRPTSGARSTSPPRRS